MGPTEAVAFGDRTNDIPMLNSVGDGIVIGDAAEPRLASFASAPSVGAWLQARRDRWPALQRHDNGRAARESCIRPHTQGRERDHTSQHTSAQQQ
ncbi:HAD hydrolase family protein [Streptomyces sp. NPDC005132]|uniref:HAD hydrolase family protein n=1 Tax=Streptomyces sp. NPDC005132 TaxID=3154294 RepID=UPI0033B740B3